LTAWDAKRQSTKQIGVGAADGSTGAYSVVGCLADYLDLLNRFLHPAG